MSSSGPIAPLAEFSVIGPRTSLYQPPSGVPGQLVIICTWLGASKKVIAKYTSLYQKVAPGARILLIESNVPILISSYARQRRELQPAVSAVLESLSECQTPSPSPSQSTSQPKILLAMFSNGGTNTASNLLINLHDRTKAPLPIAGLIFDSCPSKGTYWKSYTAMTLSLPEGLGSALLGPPAVHGILIALYSWIACGNENPASLQRRTLLDEAATVRKQWDPAGRQGRTLYLYSKQDVQCAWEDVVEHAHQARAGGWLVEEVAFDGSAHCAHFSHDPVTYLEAVEAAWSAEARNNRWLKAKL